MTSQSSAAQPLMPSLARRDLAEFGVARLRDQVFGAVLALWRRRKAEGWTQKRVAEIIGRDPGWVSRNLRAPGNWTIRTAGELIQGLDGEAEINVAALEDPADTPHSFDAYEGYLTNKSSDDSICTSFQIVSEPPRDALALIPTLPAAFTRVAAGSAVPDIFATQLRMDVTLTDFSIIFGSVDGGSTGAPSIVDRVNIHVTPGMLKKLLLNLKMAMDAYEEVMGEVKIPKKMPESLETLKMHLVGQLQMQMQMEGPPVPEVHPSNQG